MAFTNNRNVFYNNKSFDEKLFANGLGMGTPSFVCKGLDLTGTTLTAGVFNNTGAFGILGLEGETHTIPSNYTGFIVIKTTMNSQNGFNEIITSATKLDTDQRDTSNIKHFTIYQLSAGVVVQDFRHINYVKSFYLKNLGGNNIAWVLNGFESDPFDASVLAGNRTILNDNDIAYNDTIHNSSALEDILIDIFYKAQTVVGTTVPFIAEWNSNDTRNVNLDRELDAFIADKVGRDVSTMSCVFKMESTTLDTSSPTSDVTNRVTLIYSDGSIYNFIFDHDNFINTNVSHVNQKQDWSLNDLNLDGTWSSTDVVGNITLAYNKVVSLIGTKQGFSIAQGMWIDETAEHYEFSTAIRNSIINEYGYDIGSVMDFTITFNEINGYTITSDTISNYITIKTPTRSFTRQFNSNDWAASMWLDENGAPHCDVMCDLYSSTINTQHFNIDVKYRGYISGMTFWVADNDSTNGKFTVTDGTIRYIPRRVPLTPPPHLSSGNGDTLFGPNHAILANAVSAANPVDISSIASVAFNIRYADSGNAYPNGIVIDGFLTSNHVDVVLGAVIIHYGYSNWDSSASRIPLAVLAPFATSLLEEPTISDNMELPGVGDNMQDTSILKEVISND